MANSHTQLPQFSQQATLVSAPHTSSSINVHHQVNMNYQQQLMQQNSQMSSQQNLAGTPGMMMGSSSNQVSRPGTYQQMQRDSQSALMHQLQRSKQIQQPGGGPTTVGPHASSQQVIKTVSSQQSSHLNLGGMQSAQGLNFRQNLNMSLQQIQSHKNKRDGNPGSSSLGRNQQRQGAKQ